MVTYLSEKSRKCFIVFFFSVSVHVPEDIWCLFPNCSQFFFSFLWQSLSLNLELTNQLGQFTCLGLQAYSTLFIYKISRDRIQELMLIQHRFDQLSHLHSPWKYFLDYVEIVTCLKGRRLQGEIVSTVSFQHVYPQVLAGAEHYVFLFQKWFGPWLITLWFVPSLIITC